MEQRLSRKLLQKNTLGHDSNLFNLNWVVRKSLSLHYISFRLGPSSFGDYNVAFQLLPIMAVGCLHYQNRNS